MFWLLLILLCCWHCENLPTFNRKKLDIFNATTSRDYYYSCHSTWLLRYTYATIVKLLTARLFLFVTSQVVDWYIARERLLALSLSPPPLPITLSLTCETGKSQTLLYSYDTCSKRPKCTFRNFRWHFSAFSIPSADGNKLSCQWLHCITRRSHCDVFTVSIRLNGDTPNCMCALKCRWSIWEIDWKERKQNAESFMQFVIVESIGK